MTDTLHVLLLAPLYAPYFGGAETHTRVLAETLVELGQRVTVLTDRGYRSLPPAATVNGVQILRTSMPAYDPTHSDTVAWESGLFGLFTEAEQLLALHGARPDIIHAQCQISFILGAVLKEHFCAKLVVTPHETLPEDDGLGAARSRFLFSLPQIDAFVASSRIFAKQAREAGRPAEDIIMVESALRFTSPPGPPRLRIGGDSITLLSVGRFKPRKNQLALVEAMSSLKAKGVHLRCVLAGSCDAGAVDYREKVADRVRTLDLTNDVEIIDGPDDARLKQLMLDADLVVQPSLAEGLGLVVIEALLRGVPAIASPTEGACDVLKDFPMLLMPGFSPSHIAEAIIDALSRPNRYAAEASRAARSLRARFDPSVNVGRLLEIYQGRTGEAR